MIRRINTVFILFLTLLISGIRCASASEIREFIRFLGNEQPLRYEITAEFGKLPPFDEARTNKLNLLMRHLSCHGFLNAGKAALTVALDHKDLFSVLQTETEKDPQTILSTDPDHAYVLPGEETENKDSVFSFLNVFDDISSQKDIYFSLEPCAAFFEYLAESFSEKCGSAKILEKYKDYGNAVNRISLRIDANELSACISTYPENLPQGSGIPDLRNLLFSGRQDFEFLVTDEGKIMKIRYGGTAGTTENDLRTVRLEWKTVRNNSVERDELSLRTPNKDATKRNNFLLEHLWRITEDGKETFSWKAETDDLSNGVRSRSMTQCNAETDQENLSGTFSETFAEKGLNASDEIQFAISCNKTAQYSGALEIISKKDKIETGQMKIGFVLFPDDPGVTESAFPVPVAVNEAEFSGIRQRMITDFLLELLKLPSEDLVFLTEGIPEDIISEFR